MATFSKIQRRQAVAATRAVYERLTTLSLERNCIGRAQCCHFQLTGKTPHLTRGEALTAWAAVKASGRKMLPASPDGACPLLHPETGRCLIYEARPFGCRTHFCSAAGGPYPREKVIEIIRELEKIDAQFGGDGSKPLQNALREVME